MNAFMLNGVPINSSGFLLDANCFIQAKNFHYGFDFCPGFWAFLTHQNGVAPIVSIDEIEIELTRQNDQLSVWASGLGSTFFLPKDAKTVAEYAKVVLWVNSYGFSTQAIDKFMRSADGWLVAYAMAHDYVVVSHELSNNFKAREVKLPDTCKQFGVVYTDVFPVLRATGAVLKI